MKNRFLKVNIVFLTFVISTFAKVLGQPLICTIDTTLPTDGFNITQEFKGVGIHEGLDLDLKNGDPVYAFADGKVINISYQYDLARKKGWGWYIDIDHGNGIITRYAHLQDKNNNYNPDDPGTRTEPVVFVNINDTIKKGQKIAAGDATGGVKPAVDRYSNVIGDGSHLHFEIWVGTVPENPEWWLLQWTKKLEPETNKYSVNLGISTVVSLVIARDPNAKYGPQGYVTAGQTLNYTVEFENEGEGIAYGVYITDVLDKNLDDTSLVVSGFRRITADESEYPANFVYRYNPQTRMLTVFIDRDGEVFSKEGGKFSLSVKVKSDAQPGAVITNYATVYFPSVPEVTPTNPIVSVIPVQTQVTYLGDLSAKQSEVMELKALLATLDDKKVPAKTVTFFIDGSSYTATTDMEGVATLYPTAEQFPGKYTITANFAGDGFYYLPSSDSKAFEIIAIDTTPPVITLISPLGGEKFIATISTITINYIVTDDLDPSPTHYAYLTDLEEGTTIQLFNNQTIKPLDIDDGFWTLTVEAKDSAGNFTSSTTAKFEVIHDLQPPRSQLQVASPKFQVEDKTYITSTTYLTITAVDDLIELGDGKGLGVKETKYKIDENEWQVYTDSFTISLEGEHTISYYSVDLIGNKETIKMYPVSVDLTPPESQLQISSPMFQLGDKTLITSGTKIVLTAFDPEVNGVACGVASIFYRLFDSTDTPFTVYTSSFTLNLPDGERIIEYYSVDNLGNREKPKTEKLTLDNTPPVAKLVSPSPESIGLCQIFKGTIPIIGSVDDLHLKLYQIEVTTDVFLTSSFVTIKESASPATEQILTTWDTTQLIAGYYTLKLTARDLVENQTVTQVKLYIGEPQFLTSFGKHGKPKKKDDKEPFFNQPQGIALDTTNKLIYIADTNNDLIQKLDLSGNVLEIWGDKGKEDDRNNKGDKGDKGELELNKPHGLALDKEGNLYVADTNNQRVIKISSATGNILLTLGRKNPKGQFIPGSGKGEFNHPMDIALDREGNIYIADRGNARIQKFSSQGNFLSEIKVVLSTFTISEPAGIAVDGYGNIYVADQTNNCLIKYNSTGTVLMKIGSSGSQPGNFNKPQDVYVNFLGYIYLTDTNNNRIQKFDRYGNLCAYFGNLGKEENQFNKPTGLSFDSAGNLYVTDSNNSRIQVFGLPVSSPTVVVSAPSLTHSSLPTDFVLGEYYSFPNPAKNGKNPTIHFECGLADKVEIRIYDISGELVHSVTVNGEPLPVNGRYAYEYTWDISDVASGVYIYCIQAKKSGYPEIKVKKKLAVIK